MVGAGELTDKMTSGFPHPGRRRKRYPCDRRLAAFMATFYTAFQNGPSYLVPHPGRRHRRHPCVVVRPWHLVQKHCIEWVLLVYYSQLIRPMARRGPAHAASMRPVPLPSVHV